MDNIDYSKLYPPLTGALTGEMRETFSMGFSTIQAAANVAVEKFDGDLLLGLGYVEERSFAVVRGKDADSREKNLQKAAVEWAANQRMKPDILLIFPYLDTDKLNCSL